MTVLVFEESGHTETSAVSSQLNYALAMSAFDALKQSHYATDNKSQEVLFNPGKGIDSHDFKLENSHSTYQIADSDYGTWHNQISSQVLFSMIPLRIFLVLIWCCHVYAYQESIKINIPMMITKIYHVRYKSWKGFVVVLVTLTVMCPVASVVLPCDCLALCSFSTVLCSVAPFAIAKRPRLAKMCKTDHPNSYSSVGKS